MFGSSPRTTRWPVRHPDDRTILALAVPAVGALAADPLYSLVDTAFVGHLGTPQLGALAVGTAAFTLDGILIGGSDVGFLAVSMVASSALFVGLAIAAFAFEWGTAGLAAAATVWLVARTATTGARLVRQRWVGRPVGPV